MVYIQLKEKHSNIGKYINKYRTEMNKQLNTRSTIIFLIKCRKAGIVPNFITNSTKNINNIFNTQEDISGHLRRTMEKHTNNFHNKILNLLIKQKNEIRIRNTTNTKRIEISLREMITDEEATQLFKSEKNIETQTKFKLRTRHKNKFQALMEKQKEHLDIKNNENWFVNKTQTTIPKEAEWLLSHGKKFALPHEKDNFPLLQYITDGEECIKSIDTREEQDMARGQLTSMIESHINRHNITERERYILRTVETTDKFLKKNKNIIVLEADKGNVTVAMEITDYENRMSTIVNDMMTYRRLIKDPTTTLQRKNNDLVRELFNQEVISEAERRKMNTETAIAPRIYGVPKIHKEDYPLRPICSSINAPSSSLCKYITIILSKLTENSKYNVRNSTDFRERIKNMNIEDDETMVSFDVVSLFPSIPVDIAIKIIDRKWTFLQQFTTMTKGLFLKILRFCIQDNRYFKYKDKIYLQKKGLPMGSSASPIVADIVMEELLDCTLRNCDTRPKILTKYVDDLFGIIKTCAIENILTKLNSFDKNIQFTLEKESDNYIPYLDIQIIRNNGRILTNWYQKPTSSGRLVNFYSNHPKNIIFNTAINFINRVMNISDDKFYRNNLSRIKKILHQNSFPKRTIEKLLKMNKDKEVKEKDPKIFKSVTYVPKLSERLQKSNCIDHTKYKIAPKTHNTLQKLFSNMKSDIDKMDKSNVVYKIGCNGNETTKCDMVYIGTTKNKLKTRLAGHKSDIKLRYNNFTPKTALMTHCAERNHYPDLEGVRVIESERNYSKRMTLEMLNIINTTTTRRMNFKADIDGNTQCYKALISKINKIQ